MSATNDAKPLTDEEIRPSRYDEGKQRAMEEDIAWLQARRDEFVAVSCPACGSSDAAPAFSKYDFPFVRCSCCRTAYMNPRAPENMLRDFYAQSQLYAFWDRYIFRDSDAARRQKIYQPRLQRISRICQELRVPFSSVTDIGAGYGSFLDEFKQTFPSVETIAIEPNADLAQSCRGKRIDRVLQCGVEAVGAEFRSDLICCFEVIEHLFSPEALLHKCRDLLAERGLIFVSCPSYEGFDNLVLREASASIDHEHINLFNPDSLRTLFTRCGFRVEQILTPGELDAELVRKAALQHPGVLAGDPFLQYVLLDHWERLGRPFQDFLKAQCLSSHLWCVASKA